MPSSGLAKYWREFLFLAGGALVGAVLGVAAPALLFSASTSIVVLEIGKVPQRPLVSERSLALALIEDQGDAIERMQSRAFAERVALAFGDAGLVAELPARRNGGAGALLVRQLDSPERDLLEIRVQAASDARAQSLAKAVADEIIKEHGVIADPYLAAFAERLRDAHATMEEQQQLIAQLDDQLARSPGEAERSMLIAAKIIARQGLVTATEAATSMDLAHDRDVGNTEVVTGPHLRRPIASSLFYAGALGAVAGLGVAILAQAMTRQRRRIA